MGTRALEDHLDTRALKALGTWVLEVFGHSKGTWSLKALGHSSTGALEGHLDTQVLGHLGTRGTRGTLFSRLLKKVSIMFRNILVTIVPLKNGMNLRDNTIYMKVLILNAYN